MEVIQRRRSSLCKLLQYIFERENLAAAGILTRPSPNWVCLSGLIQMAKLKATLDRGRLGC